MATAVRAAQIGLVYCPRPPSELTTRNRPTATPATVVPCRSASGAHGQNDGHASQVKRRHPDPGIDSRYPDHLGPVAVLAILEAADIGPDQLDQPVRLDAEADRCRAATGGGPASSVG